MIGVYFKGEAINRLAHMDACNNHFLHRMGFSKVNGYWIKYKKEDRVGEDDDDDRAKQEGSSLTLRIFDYKQGQEVHFFTKHEADPYFDIVSRDLTKSFHFQLPQPTSST